MQKTDDSQETFPQIHSHVIRIFSNIMNGAMEQHLVIVMLGAVVQQCEKL